jgi:hypothetical protein
VSANAPAQIGYVVECPICGHVGAHGPRSIQDQNDSRFRRELPSDGTPLVTCQVGVQRYVGRGILQADVCGCDGVTGLAEALASKGVKTKERVAEKRPPCVFPGCDEESLPTSSFCSAEHLNAMVEMMAVFGKEKTNG